MSADEIKKAELRGYAKGYQAGLKKGRAEVAEKLAHVAAQPSTRSVSPISKKQVIASLAEDDRRSVYEGSDRRFWIDYGGSGPVSIETMRELLQSAILIQTYPDCAGFFSRGPRFDAASNQEREAE